MIRQEPRYLTADLQLRDIRVEIDAVQALDLKRDMPIEQLRHRHRRHHDPTSAARSRQVARSSPRTTTPTTPNCADSGV
jgi:hypothetical protein